MDTKAFNEIITQTYHDMVDWYEQTYPQRNIVYNLGFCDKDVVRHDTLEDMF